MQRRISAVVIAILVVVALLWRWGREPIASEVHPTPTPARDAPAPVVTETKEPILLPAGRVEVAPSAAVDPAPTAHETPAAAPEPADLAARDWLEIQVLDPEGRAVPEARLSIAGVRKEGDRGSWYGMRDGPATAQSDAQGRARISYTRWVDIDGRTIEVDLEVTHAEFVPFRDSSFAIGAGQHPVVLQRGATVIVSGWLGSREVVITALDIRMDRESQLPSSDWARERDGRLSTTRLAPGKHQIWLTHASEAHGNLASAIETFELAENEWKELHLELHPLAMQSGRLDEAVPRPVLDGHVWVNLNRGGSGGEPSIDRDFEAPVREDGTFELADLPPGRGQIIALCRGWVSRRTPFDPLEAVTRRLGHEPTFGEIELAFQEEAPESLEAQRIAVPSPGALVVAMERTGSLEVTVRAQDGSPLAGAIVSTSPNVFWIGVGSTIFPWREWNDETNAIGLARIDDLPPDDSLWVQAYHSAFRMTRADRDQIPSVQIVSGGTAELVLELEPKQ